MKNKTSFLTLLIMTTLVFASCSSSRNSYNSNHRKGYGCPVNASIQSPIIEKNGI